MKITGVHCKSCKSLVEDVLSDINAELKSWKLHDNYADVEIEGADFSQVKKLIESETKFKVEK